MHEVSLAQSIISYVEEQNYEEVKSITLSIGKMSGVDPSSMEFCFAPTSEGTILENAKLIIEEVPFSVRCNSCNKLSSPELFILQCSHCDSTNVKIETGDKFLIKNLEVL